MKLLTKELRNKLPSLYGQESKGQEAIAYIKFFTPSSSWTWFATEGESIFDDEGNEIDFRFFGLIYGHERELGYFTLNQLTSVKGPFGLGIERDKFFRATPLKDCKNPCSP